MYNSLSSQGIEENHLSIFSPHTNDPHQRIQGPVSIYNDDLSSGPVLRDLDIADQYNDLDFDNPEDYFLEECDPVGGHGVQSHI